MFVERSTGRSFQKNTSPLRCTYRLHRSHWQRSTATGAPATFVMHQGLYVTPVPGGTLLDPNVTSTDTGYWILAP